MKKHRIHAVANTPPPRKRFGQHFLQDTQVLEDMLAYIAPTATDHILEIGPGNGALTDYLVQSQAERIDLIEIDRDRTPALKDKYEPRATVYLADILAFDIEALSVQDHSLRVVGNLPYNISTPILFKLFSHIHKIQDIFIMLQQEVAARITARTGEHHYNRLSIMTQYFCENTTLRHVAPEAFYPAPKVHSTMIRLVPHPSYPLTATQYPHFAQLIQTAFKHRRKTIGNTLGKLIAPHVLTAAGINLQQRPQELSVSTYVKLTKMLTEGVVSTPRHRSS